MNMFGADETNSKFKFHGNDISLSVSGAEARNCHWHGTQFKYRPCSLCKN